MGVPALFPWFVDMFHEYMKRVIEGRHNFQTEDNLGRASTHAMYLDANGLLHQAAQKVMNYGAGERVFNDTLGLEDELAMNAIFDEFFDMIVLVTKTIVPTDFLYIALDGPAPIAKQNQQRQRRAVAARSRSDGFDSNQITPGTEFMTRLSDFMEFRIRQEMNNKRSNWNKIDVVYSPPSTPGEGEHKCMTMIRRKEIENMDKEYTHTIFGPDGDLIVLSLTANVRNMFLYREVQREHAQYDIIYMGDVPRQLVRQYGIDKLQLNSWNEIPKSAESLATGTFAFMGFFLGNDFLPKIQMFSSLKEGLDKTIKLINYNFQHYKEDGAIVIGKKLNIPGLTHLVHAYSEREYAQLREQVVNPDLQPRDKEFTNHTLHDSVINGVLSFDLYRQKYYTKAGISDDDGIRKLCLDYIKTLYWVYLYYWVRNVSWTWSYQYHYAPLMTDLYNVLKSIVPEEIEYINSFQYGEPSDPLQQLISVLPAKSAKWLPDEYQPILLDPSSSLVMQGIYDEHFKMDCEGKYREHQCIPLVEFTDYDIMKKVHLEHLEKLDNGDKERYQLTRYDILFENVQKVFQFENEFGQLQTSVKSSYIPMT